MAKNYDSRLVKSYRSYKIRDICRLFKQKKLHEQTVRGWINNDGLEAFRHGRIVYVYGAVLKQFLLKRNAARKQPMEFTDFQCWKCRNISPPLDSIIHTLAKDRHKSLQAVATCASCNQPVSRFYKQGDREKILETFTVEHNQLIALYDSSCEGEKTHLDEGVKNTSSESCHNPLPEAHSKNVSSTENTHINAEKSITSEKRTQNIATQYELDL